MNRDELLAWAEPERRPELGPGEVHVWFAALDLEVERQHDLHAYLGSAERARAARFVFDKHRTRYATGRGLLREMLGRYLNVPPAELEFEIGPFGKPYLRRTDGRPRLQFNYSDAGGMALVGFAFDAELGVDLESLARQVNHREIARRHFHADEVAMLERRDDAQARTDFLVCWTRKEAWGKAKGVGIRYPLDSLDLCSAIARETLTIDASADLTTLHLSQLHPAPGYVGAVAYAGDECRLRRFNYPKWQT